MTPEAEDHDGAAQRLRNFMEFRDKTPELSVGNTEDAGAWSPAFRRPFDEPTHTVSPSALDNPPQDNFGQAVHGAREVFEQAPLHQVPNLHPVQQQTEPPRSPTENVEGGIGLEEEDELGDASCQFESHATGTDGGDEDTNQRATDEHATDEHTGTHEPLQSYTHQGGHPSMGVHPRGPNPTPAGSNDTPNKHESMPTAPSVPDEPAPRPSSQTSADTDPSASSMLQTPTETSETPSAQSSAKSSWPQEEKEILVESVQWVLANGGRNMLVLEMWKKIEKRAKSSGRFTRTANACRIEWGRFFRQQTGIDERKEQKPNKLVTSAQH